MHKHLLCLIGLFVFSQTSAQCPVDIVVTANGLNVMFNPADQSVTSSSWNFGDGTEITTTQTSVDHAYTVPGTYTVCLSTTGVGCTDTLCKEIVVCDFVPDFTFEVNGNVAAFENLSTGNYDLAVWDFSDGFPLMDTSNFVIHSYNTPGTFSTCLHLYMAPNLCQTTHCEDVTIVGSTTCVNPSQIDSSIACDGFDPVCGCNGVSYDNPCQAYFYGGVTEFTSGLCPNCDAHFSPFVTGLTVSFSNTSVGDDVTYAWDFGDGQTSDESDPVHVYANPGTYVACLSISNAMVCNDVFCDTFVVDNGNLCIPKFDIFGMCDSAVFVNTSVGNYDLFAWNVNDVPTLGVDTMSVISDTGVFVVCMSLIGDSCFGNYCDTFKMHAPGAYQPGFETTFTPSALPVDVTFTAMDTAGFASVYSWDFGDGGSSNVQNPTHTFQTCNVNVCLTVSDVFGCSETICDSLYVCDIGVKSVSVENAFALYPNPGKDVCHFVVKQNITGNATLVVTDITGRVITERNIGNSHQGKSVSINTSQFAQGCFFFNVVSEKQTASLRWIKE